MASWSTQLRFFRFSGEESCDVLGISAIGTGRGDLSIKKEVWETKLVLAFGSKKRESGEVRGPEKLEMLCLEREREQEGNTRSLLDGGGLYIELYMEYHECNTK